MNFCFDVIYNKWGRKCIIKNVLTQPNYNHSNLYRV